MKKHLLASLFILICSSTLSLRAQQPISCGSGAPHPQLLRTYESTSRSGGPYVVPVIFHVYYDSLSTTFIPDYALIENTLNDMNRRFRGANADTSLVIPLYKPLVAGTNIEFRLAHKDTSGNCISGIMYHPKSSIMQITNFEVQDPNRYLNIHLNAPFTIWLPNVSAYASFPYAYSPVADLNDGIFVIMTQYALNYTPLMTHEAAHWAGLMHTFGSTNSSGGPCGDDFVADTPPTGGSPGDCNTALSNCTPGVIENVQNYMDYSNCYYMFTQGQVSRMHGVMDDTTLSRRDIWKASNLAFTGVDPLYTCAFSADFISVPVLSSSSCQYVQSYRLFAEPLTGIPDSVRWSIPGGSPAFHSGSSLTVSFAASGTYPVTMTAYKGGVPFTVTKNVAALLPPLAEISTYPFSEGFESSFSFPSAHLDVNSAPVTWTPCTFTGHNSARSIYVPQETQTGRDTNTVYIGTFDLASLSNPYLSFDVATSKNTQTIDRRLMVRAKNLCTGTVYTLNMEFDSTLAAGNTSVPFVPSSAGQWRHIETNLWYLRSLGIYDNIELSVLLVKDFTSGTQDAEFYLDNINVQDSVVTGPPVADFDITETDFCFSACYPFEFVDRSSGTPQTWRWSWIGGPYLSQPVVQGCFSSISGDSVAIRLIVQNNFGSDTAIKYVHIRYPGIFSVTASNDSICAGDTVMLSAPSGPGISYTWTGNYPPGNGLLQTTGDSVFALPVTDNNYYFATVTDSYGCTRTEGVYVYRHPDLILNVTHPSCIGVNDTVMFYTDNVSSWIYSWSPSYGLSSTTGGSVYASPDTATTYTVSVVTQGSSSCPKTETFTVNVSNPGPAINLTTADTMVCPGQSAWLYANGNDLSYTWGITPCCIGAPVSYQDSASVTPSQPVTTYSVYGTDTNGCVSDVETIRVYLQQPPEFWVSPFLPNYSNGLIVNLCGPADTTLTLIANGGAGYTYIYEPASSFIPVNNEAATFHSPTPGMHPVDVTAIDTNGCAFIRTLYINKMFTGNVAFTVSPPSPTLCAGDTMTISLSPTGNYYNYYWTPTDSLSGLTPIPMSGSGNGNGPVAQASPDVTTTYIITAIRAFNGCAASRPYTITVGSQQLTVTPPAPEICEGDSVTIQLSGASSYQWSPSGNLALSGNGSTATAFPGSTTTYTVTATGACSAGTSITVTVHPAPVIDLTAADDSICAGEATLLTASGADNYMWSPMSDLQVLGDGSTANAFPLSTLSFTVTGTDTAGCRGSDAVLITALPSPAMPVIMRNGMWLESSAADSYQWYLDGNILTGETGQQVQITSDGLYQVIVTNEWDCSSASAPFLVQDLALENESGAGNGFIYPNPSGGAFYIHSGASDPVERFELFDALGRKLQSLSFTAQQGDIPVSLSLADGWYNGRFIMQSGRMFITRIIIVR